MNDDPIIKEIRELRKKIEKECKQKNQKYFDHLLELEKEYKDRVVFL